MRSGVRTWLATVCGVAVGTAQAERVNHEGRILGPMPVVTNAVLFHTPEADAIVSALQVFPVDHAWNEDVSRRPVLANSEAMIANITAELSSSRRTLRAFYEMNYVVVQVVGRPWMQIRRQGASVDVSWAGGLPPYRLEWSGSFGPAVWTEVLETNAGPVSLPIVAGPVVLAGGGLDAFPGEILAPPLDSGLLNGCEPGLEVGGFGFGGGVDREGGVREQGGGLGRWQEVDVEAVDGGGLAGSVSVGTKRQR